MVLLQLLHFITVWLLTTCLWISNGYVVKSIFKHYILLLTSEHLEMLLSAAFAILKALTEKWAPTTSKRSLMQAIREGQGNLLYYTYGLIRYCFNLFGDVFISEVEIFLLLVTFNLVMQHSVHCLCAWVASTRYLIMQISLIKKMDKEKSKGMWFVFLKQFFIFYFKWKMCLECCFLRGGFENDFLNCCFQNREKKITVTCFQKHCYKNTCFKMENM